MIKKRWHWLGILTVIGLVMFGMRLWGLSATGNNWDEYFYYDATHNFLQNVRAGNFDAADWNANREHPPLGKYVYAPALLWNSLRDVPARDAYHAPRLIAALLGTLTILLLIELGRRFFTLRVGLVAGLIYGLLPSVLAYHQLINLDVTMVLFWTLAMFFFLEWLVWGEVNSGEATVSGKASGGRAGMVSHVSGMSTAEEDGPPHAGRRDRVFTKIVASPLFSTWAEPSFGGINPRYASRFLWLAVLFGSLAFATKFNAFLLLVVFFGVLLIKERPNLRSSGSLRLPLPLLLLPLVYGAVLLAVWPWLWGDTLRHLIETLGHWGGRVGEIYLGHTGEAPLHYFLVHFFVGTPFVILLLMIVGLWKLFSDMSGAGSSLSRHLIPLSLLLWLAAPFLISFYHLRQDHLRYILAAYPAVALLAALGFWWLVDRLSKQSWVTGVGVLGLAAYLLFGLIKIHPYYLNYYNSLVGGVNGVSTKRLFSLGFYGEGIKEATEYVNRTAPDGATVHFEILPDDVPYFDWPRLNRFDEPGADYLIVNLTALDDPEKRTHINLDGYEEVYVVRADQAPFVWVYQKRPN